MIKVIAGLAIYNDGVKCRAITAADGAVTLPDEVEERFVRQGVARYVGGDEPTAKPEPVEAVEEVEEIDEAEEADETPDYESMSASELKAECDARGITYNARSSKAQLIDALVADDEPPALDALGAE